MTSDRSLRVPAGCIVLTGYVPVHRVRLGCRDRMAVGDVETAYRKRLQLGAAQEWPPPRGRWENDDTDGARQFVIEDGRHAYVAALMCGLDFLLVAWVEDAPARAA